MAEKKDVVVNDSIKKKVSEKIGGEKIADGVLEEILKIISTTAKYEPKVGILGKTGVGKSELCNALFGKDVAEVSDIESCTKNPEAYLLDIADDQGIKLIDVPGIGESVSKDKMYKELYSMLLPELDLVLWVLKADARSYSLDEEYFNNFLKPNNSKIPLLIVLNQVDKIEPYREWNTDSDEPGETQKVNIQKKVESIHKIFEINENDIVPTSATDKFGLNILVEKIIVKLPDKKKFGFLRFTRKENRSKESKDEARAGFLRSVKEAASDLFDKHGDKIIMGLTLAVFEIFRQMLQSGNDSNKKSR